MEHVLNGYEVVRHEDSYYFLTGQGIKYSVVFTHSEYSDDIGIELKEISFFHDGTPQKNKDPIIGKTIVKIIKNYCFLYPSIGIVYVCLSTDRKHHARNRIFKHWFDEYNTEKQYLHLSLPLRDDSEDLDYYNAMIIPFNSPSLEEIKENYQKIIDLFQSFK